MADLMYERLIQIEFNHCDPAGIVFYPRYFEMVNSVIENFFADVVGRSFAAMHNEGGRNGVPTVAMEAVFQRPSRLGDKVRFTLRVERVGGSSVKMGSRGRGRRGCG
jgi:4-hydroxybenzoyl-CoA thioesterase